MMQVLKNFVKKGANTDMHDLNFFVGIPLTPGELLLSSNLTKFSTSSVSVLQKQN